MLETIFPEAVQVIVAEPWMWDSPVDPIEEAAICGANERRIKEFRAGRHCAHSALQNLGASCSVVKKGLHREPVWPKGYVGSFSHTTDHCSVVAAKENMVKGIGHDVELCTPLPTDVISKICSPKEQQRILELLDYPAPVCKLFFSAKECVYKLYFPLNAHKLSFADADITFDLDGQSWTAVIGKPAPKPRLSVNTLHGYFRYDSQYIFTGCYL